MGWKSSRKNYRSANESILIRNMNDIKKSSNTVQAFWVMLGSLSAFGFVIVSSMLLSRYFDKHTYGTYKQVMYVYSSLLVVFTLGLPKAYSYFLPRVNEGQAKDLISKINSLLLILGAVMTISLFLGANIIADILNNPDLNTPLRYFALVPFFMLPTMGLEGILATYRQTKFLAVYKTLTQIFMLLCVVIPVVFFEGTINSAIVGFTIASFLCFATALYLKYMPIRTFAKEKSPYSFRQILDYTLPLMGAGIWGLIIASSDQFFISRYFGSEIFAEFANGSIELPFVGMIIGSTSVVLSPIFSRLSHERLDPRKDIFPIWKSVFEKSAKLIYPLVVFALFFADIIMVLLYGKQYENSSVYFRIKLILNFFTIIVYAPLLINIGKVKFYSRVHLWTAIGVIALELLIVSTLNSPYFVAIASLGCQLAKTYVLLHAVANFFDMKIYELFPVGLLLKIVLASVVILSAEYYLLVIYLKIDYLYILLLGFLIYILSFGLFSRSMKIDYLYILKPLFKKISN